MNIHQRRQHRLRKLREHGIIQVDSLPNPWQVSQAANHMFSFTTLRSPEDMQEESFDTWLSRMPQRGVMQFFTGSFFNDPTGLSREKHGLVWHVLSLNHQLAENVVFDIEMLASMEGGLELLISETRALMSGAHPRTFLARQLVGTDEYWPMILEQARLGLKGQFSEGTDLAKVQNMVDLCLSFPATFGETLAHKAARETLVSAPFVTLQNLYKSLSNSPDAAVPMEERDFTLKSA